MGIVYRQSFSNTVVTYLGFGIGAINYLFLFTRFLSDEYFGLVGVILSTSALLMPILAFGVPNTMVKYYSSFRAQEDRDGFLTFMVLLPLAFILPVAVISYAANAAIGQFLARENAIVGDYVWHIFLIGLAMAYFEIYYAWAKVQMKSVFGNFMKEVFVRAGIFILLFGVYFEWLSVTGFLKALVALYLLRSLVMSVYAHVLKPLRWQWHMPPNIREILIYSSLIILGGSAAVMLLEIDRFMINQFIEIEQVAYYSVAIYIATVIAVPSRAMHQVTYPLTAEILNRRDRTALKQLYRKSSLTLFIISGLLFLLIIINLADFYLLLPESYRGGFTVVFLIGLAKVYDALLGNNNAILFNSDYYRTVLVMGVLLAALTIILNLWLIPALGINGAALATFLALFLYNTAKIVYVRLKFGMVPLTGKTLQAAGMLLGLGVLCYYIPLQFHPVANIALKSTLIVILYLGMLYRFRVSEDVVEVLARWFGRPGK